jgi:type IV pilus assembly protein PilC
MTNYRYIARSLGGQRQSGFSEALTRKDVLMWLREQGLIPVEIEEADAAKRVKLFSRPKRVTSADLASFCWQLRTMFEGGVPITGALSTIGQDCENKHFQKIIGKVTTNVEKGETLSDSLARHPKVFSKLFQTMITAGEKGGALTTTLGRLAEYYDNRDTLARKVKGAMAYPAFVVGFIIFLVIFIMTFIIPRFKTLFEQIGGDLPVLTKIFIAGYDFVVGNLFYMAGFFVVGLVSLTLYFRTPVGWSHLSRFLLKAPLVGKLLAQAFVAMFCRTFATLLSAGVSVLDALEILATMSSNTVIQLALRRTRERIVEGSSISLSMAASGFFPNLLIKMVEVGEESGSLPEVLERTSGYYEKRVDAMVTTMTALLEPILIVSVGAIVLGVVLALYLPIFMISDIRQ